jgi:hypothetical protein
MLRGHFSGKALDALMELHSLTKKTGHFFRGSPRSASDARVGLANFLTERGICSDRWAREIVKDLLRRRWLEICVFDGRLAILVRKHREWATLTGSSACSFSDETNSSGAEGGSAKSEQSSAQTEETAASTEGTSEKRRVSPIDAAFAGSSSEAVPGQVPTGEDPRAEGKKTGTASQRLSSTTPVEQRQGTERSDLLLMMKKASVHRMRRYDRKLQLFGKDLESAAALLEEYEPDDVADAYGYYIDDGSEFLRKTKHPWGIFAKQFDDYYPGEQLAFQDCDCPRCGKRWKQDTKRKYYSQTPYLKKCIACEMTE